MAIETFVSIVSQFAYVIALIALVWVFVRLVSRFLPVSLKGDGGIEVHSNRPFGRLVGFCVSNTFMAIKTMKKMGSKMMAEDKTQSVGTKSYYIFKG